MGDVRATIVLTGEVQDAGVRGKIMRIAQKLGLVGYVENLPNGTVRIVCEGPEDAIREFSGKLDIHDEDIDVEDISVEWSDAAGEFEWFEVKFDNLGMEMFQGFATAGRKLSDVSKKVDESIQATKEVGWKVEDMHTDLKEGFRETKEGLNHVEASIGSMHEDINTRFDTLDVKYGEFGEKMTTLEHNISELTWQIKRLVDHVVGEETGKDSE